MKHNMKPKGIEYDRYILERFGASLSSPYCKRAGQTPSGPKDLKGSNLPMSHLIFL